jgi:hypothetical protein
VYHVGGTHDQVRNAFLAAEARLNKYPAGGFFNGDNLLTLFDFAAAGVYIWEDDASALSSYVRTGDATALLTLWQFVAGPAETNDNGYAAYLATLCSDAPWPRSQTQLNRTTWKLDQSYPYFAWFIAWQDGPCAYWPFASSQPVTVSGQNVHVPILMIDETFDPETPYEGSLYVRSIFPTASLIEGRNGTTHAGQLSGVPCSDDTIANYLLSGTVPVRQSGNRSDKVCPPVPQPDPTQNSSIESADVTTTTTAAALRTSTAAQLLEP